MKETVTVVGTDDANERNKNLAFIPCIPKNNNAFIDNEEDLDIGMAMYNLLEYSKNYSMTSGSLSNYYRDEVNDEAS